MPSSETISILDGSTFVVSDTHGDIDAAPDQPHGFFFRDTLFLSRWRLKVGNEELEVLSTENTDYFAAQFFLCPPTGTIYENPYLSVMRKRKVGDGFHEDVALLNHRDEPRGGVGPARGRMRLRRPLICSGAGLPTRTKRRRSPGSS